MPLPMMRMLGPRLRYAGAVLRLIPPAHSQRGAPDAARQMRQVIERRPAAGLVGSGVHGDHVGAELLEGSRPAREVRHAAHVGHDLAPVCPGRADAVSYRQVVGDGEDRDVVGPGRERELGLISGGVHDLGVAEHAETGERLP